MNYTGIIIGGAAFLIIGIFHPIVIKTEYHLSKKVWPVFLFFGAALLIVSLFVKNEIVSPLLGVTGCSALWSIGELFEQEKRVKKGWFPKKTKQGEPFEK